jgi:hypothetical protein
MDFDDLIFNTYQLFPVAGPRGPATGLEQKQKYLSEELLRAKEQVPKIFSVHSNR